MDGVEGRGAASGTAADGEEPAGSPPATAAEGAAAAAVAAGGVLAELLAAVDMGSLEGLAGEQVESAETPEEGTRASKELLPALLGPAAAFAFRLARFF